MKFLIKAGFDERIAECMVISAMKAEEKLESENKKGKPLQKQPAMVDAFDRARTRFKMHLAPQERFYGFFSCVMVTNILRQEILLEWVEADSWYVVIQLVYETLDG